MTWWYVGVFAVLAVLLVIAFGVRVSQRRRAGLSREHASPPAARHPAALRHAPPPTERGSSGGAFRAGDLGAGLKGLFRHGTTDATWQALEDLLLRADLGPQAASDLVARVRADHAGSGDVVGKVHAEIVAILGSDEPLAIGEDLTVVLVVGVNGSGKTTTIGKLAKRLASEGRVVSVAAADTFRAAAGEQLEVWARVAGAHLIAQERGADPGSVAFDAVKASAARGVDVLIVDTAGRLHTKQPLMDELAKVKRVLEKAAGDVEEVLLVVDATTGQNGLQQARVFTDAVGVTGVALTKLDGTAKGGIVLAVREELGVPVKLIGTGERIKDLDIFDPELFAERLLAV